MKHLTAMQSWKYPEKFESLKLCDNSLQNQIERRLRRKKIEMCVIFQYAKKSISSVNINFEQRFGK